jgi:hypothetical protein
VTLEPEDTLLDGKATDGYFLEDGIASVVVSTVEVGVIGIDGVVGLPTLLGTEGSPGRTFIPIAGSGYSILDRTALENTACECCGIVRDEFRRLSLA